MPPESPAGPDAGTHGRPECTNGLARARERASRAASNSRRHVRAHLYTVPGPGPAWSRGCPAAGRHRRAVETGAGQIGSRGQHRRARKAMSSNKGAPYRFGNETSGRLDDPPRVPWIDRRSLPDRCGDALSREQAEGVATGKEPEPGTIPAFPEHRSRPFDLPGPAPRSAGGGALQIPRTRDNEHASDRTARASTSRRRSSLAAQSRVGVSAERTSHADPADRDRYGADRSSLTDHAIIRRTLNGIGAPLPAAGAARRRVGVRSGVRPSRRAGRTRARIDRWKSTRNARRSGSNSGSTLPGRDTRGRPPPVYRRRPESPPGACTDPPR
jgi:hypothetical protein